MLKNGRVFTDNTLILDAYTIEIGLEQKHSQIHTDTRTRKHTRTVKKSKFS